VTKKLLKIQYLPQLKSKTYEITPKKFQDSKIFVNMKSFQEIQELDDFSKLPDLPNLETLETLDLELWAKKCLNPKEFTSHFRCNNNLSNPKDDFTHKKQISKKKKLI